MNASLLGGIVGILNGNTTLEGSVRNYDPPVFALPSGLDALNSGRYFVDHRDNAYVLDKLCKALRLRGIQCEAGD